MKEYKAMAHIHSLNGEMAEITVLEEVGDNDYIVDYNEGIGTQSLFLLRSIFPCSLYFPLRFNRMSLK